MSTYPFDFELKVLNNIIGELGAAVMQSTPSDDQIIMDHVKSAHTLARSLREHALAKVAQSRVQATEARLDSERLEKILNDWEAKVIERRRQETYEAMATIRKPYKED